MSAGDIFDESFDLYKRNFALFAGIVAVIHVPASVLLYSFSYRLGLDRLARGQGGEPEAMQALGILGVLFALGAVNGLLYIVQSGALSLAISERHLGRPATILGAYRRALPALPSLIITWLLIAAADTAAALGLFLGVALCVGLLAAATATAGGAGNTIAGVLAALLLAVPVLAALGLIIAWSVFVTQVIVIERTGYISAMERNWRLISGRFLRICGILTLLTMVVAGLTWTIEGSVEWALDAFVYPNVHASTLTRAAVNGSWSAVVSLVLQPYSMVCLTLLYYDQRVRKEGFDLALLERQLLRQPVEPAR